MIYLSVVSLIGGFIYLLMGGDLLVRGAVALARRASVPPVVVALTVVALGTSLPELVVSVQAVLTGYPGIALGNVVGSNIANILLVAGGAAVVYPLAFPGGSIRRDSAIMLLVSVAFLLFCLVEGLNRGMGVLFLGALVVVMVFTVRDAARAHSDRARRAPTELVLGLPTHRPVILLFIGAGLLWLPLGARLVVESAVEIATMAGMSETMVGLTIIAFSTSLPELATTMVAAYRKETDVALGTLVGSNNFNILAIMGASALVAPEGIPVPLRFPYLDLPLMLVSSAAVTALMWGGRSVGRRFGVLLLTVYVGYLMVLLLLGTGS